jgi:hypothetical protein
MDIFIGCGYGSHTGIAAATLEPLEPILATSMSIPTSCDLKFGIQ